MRLSPLQKLEMSSLLTYLSAIIPREFARKPRSMNEILRWKATEYRQFLLYTGLFNHFLLLSCSYRMLVSPNISEEIIEKAHNMLSAFVEQFSNFYGETSVTRNMHNLLHLRETARQYGNLTNVTAYPFENMNQTLKKAVRNPQFITELLFNIFNDIPLEGCVEEMVSKGAH